MPVGIINQVIPNFLYICDALRDLVPLIQFKKHEKKSDGGMLLLVNLQAPVCDFTKTNTLPCVFHVFKIVQTVPNRTKRLISNGKRNKHFTILPSVMKASSSGMTSFWF